ncbi:MAG: sulfatase [Myxococcota bacterium]|nr:sulfatase [Myxococcota bacterium]
MNSSTRCPASLAEHAAHLATLAPKSLGVALGTTLLALAGCGEGPPRPNIVLIVTDDQAASTLAHMPFVERDLVRPGVTFENFILNDPICCPSRVTILLGQYRHNHQLEVGHPGGCAHRFLEDQDEEQTIGALIQGAGYHTGIVGKYLNSYKNYLESRIGKDGNPLLTGWDDYHVLAGFTRYYDFFSDENGELVRHDEKPFTYQTDYLSQRAQSFIRRAKRADEPFFLYIAPEAPHAPTDPAVRHYRSFKQTYAPRVASFNQADVSTQPSLKDVPRLDQRAERLLHLRYRRHLETLQAVDELVRDVVATLEATGLLDQTFIFFTTDNGHHFGEHRIAEGKATPFEESIRFPLIVRGPGVAPDRVLEQLASNVDIHPPLLDLSGLAADPRVDGASLLPLLRDSADAQDWRTAVVIESVAEGRNQGVPAFHGIRTGRYKLIRYRGGARELYDLAADPHETTNVLDSVAPTLTAALDRRLDALIQCSGESCRAISSAPAPGDVE